MAGGNDRNLGIPTETLVYSDSGSILINGTNIWDQAEFHWERSDTYPRAQSGSL